MRKNLTVPEAIKERYHVKWPLICEIGTNFNYEDNELLHFTSQNSFASPPPSTSSQHESFSFDSTSSSSEFTNKLVRTSSSSLEFPKKPALDHALDTSCSAPISPCEECSSNNKVNVDHEDLSFNDHVPEKSIDRPSYSSIAKTISFSYSNLESKTSDLNAKSLLVAESSFFNKDHEAKSSNKRTKEE